MAIKLGKLIEMIEQKGWYFKRQGKGSHMIFRHPVVKKSIILPNHGMNKEVSIGVEQNTLKTAGLK